MSKPPLPFIPYREHPIWQELLLLEKEAPKYNKSQAAQREFCREASQYSALFFIQRVFQNEIRRYKLEFIDPETGGVGYHALLLWDFVQVWRKKFWMSLIAFRGSGKTVTNFMFGFPWIALTQNPGGSSGELTYITASKQLAARKGMEIRTMLERNPYINTIWGPQKGPVWNKLEMWLANDWKFYLYGIEQKNRGPHPLYILLDDVEDDDSADSEDITQDIEDYIFKMLVPQIKNDDPLFFQGTNIGPGSVIDRVHRDPKTQKPRHGWTVKEYAASDEEWTKALWPSVWGLHALRERRARIGAWAFDSEYMCRPHGRGETMYRRADIERNTIEPEDVPPRDECTVLFAFDPGYAKKKKSNATGWCELWIPNKPPLRLIVFNCKGEKLNGEEKADKIIDWQEFIRPDAVFLEEEREDDSLRVYIIHRAAMRGVLPNIQPVKSGGKSKERRGSSVQGLVESGVVKFIRDKYPVFIERLLRFPDKKVPDDEVDAFHYDLQQGQVWFMPEVVSKDSKNEKPKTKLQSFLARKREQYEGAPGESDPYTGIRRRYA